jgi:hypothetical protein
MVTIGYDIDMARYKKGVDKGSRSISIDLPVKFFPVRPPMKWVDTLEDVPPFDWTRGALSPIMTIQKSPEELENREWFGVRPTPQLGHPRLVRVHAGRYVNSVIVKDYEVLNTLARLAQFGEDTNFARPDSKFRKEVLRTAHKIGLLRPAPDTQLQYTTHWDADSVHVWRTVCIEVAFWKDLSHYMKDWEDFPIPRHVWDGLRRDYKAYETEEIAWEIDGKPQYVWNFKQGIDPEVTRQRFGFINDAQDKTQKAKTKLEAMEAIAKKFYQLFMSVGNMCFDTSSVGEQGFVNFIGGAQPWAYFELSRLYRAQHPARCGNCGKSFESNRTNAKWCTDRCEWAADSRRKYANRKLVLQNLEHDKP